MARAPVSKTGGWGFESLHSCHDLTDVAHWTGFPAVFVTFGTLRL